MSDIKKEEYSVIPCTSCGNNSIVDMERIKYRIDTLCDKKSFDEVENIINYWLKEVSAKGDERTELELQNEYIGFLRKQGRKEDAITHAKRCVELIDKLSLKDTVSGATIYLNVATVYKAFDEPQIALSFFMKAEQVYDKSLKAGDVLFAGLYNNMALALVDLGQYDAAEKKYNAAIEILSKSEKGALDEAISYLNLADLLYKKYKTDPSDDYSKYGSGIEKNCLIAWELLNEKDIPKDAYYRFVCEKCAPTFGYYGYFVYERELKKRASEHENI